jgi:hypothetical protein
MMRSLGPAKVWQQWDGCQSSNQWLQLSNTCVCVPTIMGMSMIDSDSDSHISSRFIPLVQ